MPGSPDWVSALRAILITNGTENYWSEFAAENFINQISEAMKREASIEILEMYVDGHQYCEVGDDGECAVIDEIRSDLDRIKRGGKILP